MAGGAYLSPTRKGHTNDKSPVWRRHTMSDWHRSTFGEESNFVKPGKIIIDRPMRTLASDTHLPSSNILTSMSMTFSERIISPELMAPHIITNKTMRPPRHLDPRIRGWDLNTAPWWPCVLQNVNKPRPLSSERERPQSGSSGAPGRRRRASTMDTTKSAKSNKGESKASRATSAPLLPVLKTRMALTVSPHYRTAALRRHVEHLHKGSHLNVGDNLGRAGGHDLNYAHWHHCESRHPTRLIYDLPHADQGADRQFPYDVGHTVGPTTMMLDGAMVP